MKLEEITSLITDYVANGSFASLRENAKYVSKEEGYARVIRLTDENNNYSEEDAIYVNEPSYRFLSKSKLSPGDIIVTNVGAYLGTVFQCPSLNIPMTLGPNAILIKPNLNFVSNTYLYYLLSSNYGHERLISLVSGSAMPKFNKTDLRNMSIDVHTRTEQQHIVNIIGSVDDLIEKYASLTNKAKYLARLLFNDTFPELSLDGINSPKRLDDYLEKITTGLNPRQNFKLGHGSNYYVTVKNIDDGRLLLNESCDKVDDEALLLINKRSQLDKGTILFTGIGSIGRTFFVYEKPKNWNISESVFAFKAGNNISPEFLYMLLTSDVFQSYCINNASGSAQKGIRMEYLKKYPMPVLKKEKMQLFNSKIKPLVNLLFEYDKRTTQLLKAKQFFLNKYF